MSTPREWSGHVFIATNVDGYIALPDGNLEWLTDPPVGTKHAPAIRPDSTPVDYDEFAADITHLVMGRGTYDKVITFDSAETTTARRRLRRLDVPRTGI